LVARGRLFLLLCTDVPAAVYRRHAM